MSGRFRRAGAGLGAALLLAGAPCGSASAQTQEAGPAQGGAVPMVRIAELDIAPDQIGPYRALLEEEIRSSIAREPGVLMLYAVAVKGAPTQIRLTEVYADRVAYESHLKSPHFVKYKTATAAMVRSLRLIETDPVLLCGKADRGTGRGC
jgi:quinol monooxygenase YgiN